MPSESAVVDEGMSEVNATVPEASLNVIVRSAVGSITVSVVSNHLLLHLQKRFLFERRQPLQGLTTEHHRLHLMLL